MDRRVFRVIIFRVVSLFGHKSQKRQSVKRKDYLSEPVYNKCQEEIYRRREKDVQKKNEENDGEDKQEEERIEDKETQADRWMDRSHEQTKLHREVKTVIQIDRGTDRHIGRQGHRLKHR